MSSLPTATSVFSPNFPDPRRAEERRGELFCFVLFCFPGLVAHPCCVRRRILRNFTFAETPRAVPLEGFHVSAGDFRTLFRAEGEKEKEKKKFDLSERDGGGTRRRAVRTQDGESAQAMCSLQRRCNGANHWNNGVMMFN